MATNTYAVSHLASPLDKIIGMKFQNTLQTQKPIANLFNWVNATERNQIYPIQISRNGDAGVKTESGALSYDRAAFIEATFSPQMYGVGESRYLKEQIMAESNSSPYPKLMHDLNLLVNDVVNSLNNAIITADGSSSQITGFTTIIGDSGTYAGIDSSVYTTWTSYVDDAGGSNRTLRRAMLDTMIDAMKVRSAGAHQGNQVPGVIFTSQNIKNQIRNWGESYVRFNPNPGQPYALNIGADDDMIFYRGRQIIDVYDGDTSGTNKLANTLLYVTPSDCEIRWWGKSPYNVRDIKSDAYMMDIRQIYIVLQFCCFNRFTQGRINDISE